MAGRAQAVGPHRPEAAIAGQPAWRAAALALVLGASAALAQPPFHALPLLLPAFVGLVWLIDGRRRLVGAGLIGWMFGLGYFLVGLHWVANAFLVDASRHALVMAPAVFGLAAGMALFPALAAVAARRAPGGDWRRPVVLALAWVVLEWVRGWLFTGFPWSLIGHAAAFSDPLMQGASIAGVFGLSAVLLLAASLPARWRHPGGRWGSLVAFVALGLLWGFGEWRLARPLPADGASVPLRIVQPNIAQALKWRRELRQANFERHLALSAKTPAAAGTVLIWPETATPFFLDESEAARRRIGALLPADGLALIGSPRRVPTGPLRLRNSLLAVQPDGRVAFGYDKHHLVPFGEFLPFRDLLGHLGLDKFAAGAVDYSPGPGPRTLVHPGLPALWPLICYEAIFATETPAERPQWLLNVTNDAWFGDSIGPRQHFEIARFRAIEQGLPLIRAANTGISAVVDARGRVAAALPLGEAGVLDAMLPPPLADATLYSRFADWTWFPVVFIGFFSALFRRGPPAEHPSG